MWKTNHGRTKLPELWNLRGIHIWGTFDPAAFQVICEDSMEVEIFHNFKTLLLLDFYFFSNRFFTDILCGSPNKKFCFVFLTFCAL